MHLDPNDPLITTYALGELDAVQTAALDEHLRECESCRQAVAEIRNLAGTLSDVLHSAATPKLQPVQREAVENRLKIVNRPRLVTNKLFLAMAASLLVAVGIGVYANGLIPWGRSAQESPSAHWQKDDVAYVPDSSDYELNADARALNFPENETSRAGGRPGNVAGGPQPTAAADHAAQSPTTVKTVPFHDRHLYYTGDDNAPIAPRAESHALRPATTTPSSATPGSSQTASENKTTPSSGEQLKGSRKGKSVFDLNDKQRAAQPSANDLTSGPPATTSRPTADGKLKGFGGRKVVPTQPKPAAEPAAPGTMPTTTSSPATATTNTGPVGTPSPIADPSRPSDVGKPKERETSLTVSKPVYETKPRTDGPAPVPLAEGLKMAPNVSGANPRPVMIPPRTGEKPGDFSKPSDPKVGVNSNAGLIGNVVVDEDVKTQQGLGNEAYAPVVDNTFLPALQNPLSTFSIDVDTASYANIRRMLSAGQRPPKDAVRIEEMVNYFSYDYAPPKDDKPFSAHVEMADCPWQGEHRLVRIGLKGKDLGGERRPACNLVFLLDVSGSMAAHNKLPLVKESMRLLIDKLNEEDNVAIVVYAGASGLALPTTSCEQKQKILSAIDNLQAGGSTNGGAGIQLAYDTAAGNFIRGGVNRVILCTDGDFNVGITSRDALTNLIQEKAKGGVFLSVLGFGMGNLKDATLEKLADMGNGNYAYIDSREEAHKVLVRQLNGTLVTIAKDVKIQVEFNPAVVSQYRLIGYENRVMKAEDFNNDKKDAGEIGAGHTVTALYEIVPATKADGAKSPDVDALKYQKPAPANAVATDEVMTLKLRYKAPDGDTSKLIEFPVKDEVKRLGQASADFRFAAAVAAFGMLLRNSEHRGSASWDGVIELAGAPAATADQPQDDIDESKSRVEFLEMVRRAKQVVGE